MRVEKSGTIIAMRKMKTLYDAYRFPGFRPLRVIKGVFGDPKARVIQMVRRGKKRSAGCVEPSTFNITTTPGAGSVIYPTGTHAFISRWRFGGWPVGGAVR